jgi:hypothetical protein
MGSHSRFFQSSDNDRGWYIDNWRRGAINWTSSTTVSRHSVQFCIMVNSIETNSTKSSIISGKAVSLKKSVQKGAKAIARPFKKLKKSISTPLTRSIRSRSSTTSDNENADHGNEPSADSQGDGSGSEPEDELTPQEELSTLFNYHLIINTNYICVRGTPGALALTHLHLLQIGCRFPVP